MKKFISLFLIISVLIVSINTTSVYASFSDNQGDRIEQNIVKFTNGVLDGYSRLLRYAGIIIDSGIEASRYTMQFIKDRLISLGLLQNGASDEEVEQFFDDNIIQNGKNIEFTQNLNVYIKSEIAAIQNTYGYFYAYSIDILKNTSLSPSGDWYNATKTILENNQSNYLCNYREYSGNQYLFLFPISKYGPIYYQDFANRFVNCTLRETGTWNEGYYDTGYTRVSAYRYNSSTNQWDSYSGNTGIGGVNFRLAKKSAESVTGYGFSNCILSYNGDCVYKVYRTLNDFKNESVGNSPYYISDSYNEYSEVSGSYNTVTDDHTVTYSDIVNFNNTYYGDNGNYPTAETIYQYINTNEGTDTPSDNTPSGGGDGDDNGGSIFDWLSRIGALIGDLISGVGGFITGILEGIVNALTTIFESITSIITNITSVIPDSLNSLMTSILGWLPEEWTAVLSAFLLVSLLVGLFKLFRG